MVDKKAAVGTPWRWVLSTPPIWGQFVCDFCQAWFGYIVLTFLPQYVHDQLGFDMAQSGFLVALPNIVSFVSLWLSAVIADNAIRTGHSVPSVRIWMSIVGGLPPAACIVCMLYSNDAATIIVLLNICLFFQFFYSADGALTILDLFPDHAGTIMGIDNGLNNIPGFLALITAGWVLDGGGCPIDATEKGHAWQPPTASCAAAWAQLWWLSAGLYIFGTFVYVASFWFYDYPERDGTVVKVGSSSLLRHPATGQAADEGRWRRRGVPTGALLCDRLLFGRLGQQQQGGKAVAGHA